MEKKANGQFRGVRHKYILISTSRSQSRTPCEHNALKSAEIEAGLDDLRLRICNFREILALAPTFLFFLLLLTQNGTDWQNFNGKLSA